jgi:DNA-binding XRE family transcriptional regulator
MDNRLRALRLERNLVQAELAVRARCSPGTVGAAERYGYRPSAAICQRLARALRVKITDIWPAEEAVGA